MLGSGTSAQALHACSSLGSALEGQSLGSRLNRESLQAAPRQWHSIPLSYLKEKLGRLPVPDVGQHLDDLFVKLRRQPGTDLLSWCTQLRETYRRVQRALARTFRPKKEVGVQTERSMFAGEDAEYYS